MKYGEIYHFHPSKCDHPLSIYAASKKSNELMAHSQSSIQITNNGLEIFTVYGPWGSLIWLYSNLQNRLF